MQNPSSPLDTLRQLKEMLDAGALTPAEFEALKQRLVIQEPSNTPAAPPAPGSADSPPPLPFTPTPEPIAPTPIPVAPEELPGAAVPYEASAPAPFAPPVATAPEPDEAWEEEVTDFPADEAPAKNNSLALLLSIGGVLVFLALVAYLALNQAPSERLSSTSQTAADSLAAPIETGPQAAPLPPSTAVPETIRVVPSNPAPVVQPQPAVGRPDSAVTAPPSAFPDSAMRQ